MAKAGSLAERAVSRISQHLDDQEWRAQFTPIQFTRDVQSAIHGATQVFYRNMAMYIDTRAKLYPDENAEPDFSRLSTLSLVQKLTADIVRMSWYGATQLMSAEPTQAFSHPMIQAIDRYAEIVFTRLGAHYLNNLSNMPIS